MDKKYQDYLKNKEQEEYQKYLKKQGKESFVQYALFETKNTCFLLLVLFLYLTLREEFGENIPLFREMPLYPFLWVVNRAGIRIHRSNDSL